MATILKQKEWPYKRWTAWTTTVLHSALTTQDTDPKDYEVFICERSIRLFRIISIPSKFCYFRPPDHMISMELLALNFRCQCTQQKLQSICAILMFDPQLKKKFCKRQISIKLFYLYQRLQCRDKYFFKIKFVFFFYLRRSASSKENDLPLCIYFWYQTDSGVQNVSFYSAVSLASSYYNYL